MLAFAASSVQCSEGHPAPQGNGKAFIAGRFPAPDGGGRRWGPNELAEGRQKGLFRVFLEQVQDFLVVIFIVAAVVSGDGNKRAKKPAGLLTGRFTGFLAG